MFCHVSFWILRLPFSEFGAAEVGDYATGQHLDDNPLVSLTQMPMGGIWQAGGAGGLLGEWLVELAC